jgi:hypothetical protein
MTPARFDARASITWARRFARLPRLDRNSVACRIVRLIWVATQLMQRDPATIAGHRRQFRALWRSLCYEIKPSRRDLRYFEALVFCDFRRMQYLDDLELGHCRFHNSRK